jgi:hypothetical protein
MNTPSPFIGLDVSWNRMEEPVLPLNGAGSAGVARVRLGPNFPGSASSPTGLANDATVYTATLRFDDATTNAISIVGSAAQTITTLLAELNTDVTTPVVTLEGNELVFTSATTGPASSVFISDTGTNFLFASLRGDTDPATLSTEKWGVVDYDSTRGWAAIAGSANRVGRSERGNVTYLRWDKMDDVHQEHVIAVVNTFLSSVATGNQPWVNAAAGIAITGGVPTQGSASELSRATVYQLQLDVNGDGNVTIYADLNVPQTTGESFSRLVQAINTGIANAVRADGSKLPVVCEWQQGVDGTTQPSMLVFRVLDSFELFSATSAGNLEQGAGSAVVITDGLANGLVAALTATATWTAAIDTAQAGFGVVSFNRVNAAAVLPATVPAVPAGNYDFTVAVEDAGVRASYNVTVAVTAADSMTVIAASMQAALRTATGELEEVTAVGNSFLIANEAAGTGFNTQVVVTIPTAGANSDLFNAIAAALDVVDSRGDTSVSTYAVDGFATPGVDGAVAGLSFPETYNGVSYANWGAVLGATPIGGRVGSGQFIHGLTGFGPLFTSGSAMVFEKESRPQALGQCVNRSVYWDGAAWRYFVAGDASRVLADDTSAGTNNPPQTLASGA